MPLLSLKETNSSASKGTDKTYQNTDTIEESKLDDDEKKVVFRATENVTDAVRGMIIIVRVLSKEAFENKIMKEEKEQDSEFVNICNSLFAECISCLSLYKKTRHIFSLILISTTEFIQRFHFSIDADKEESAKAVYESLKRLHVLKSIGYSIFIRNTLASLSKELLISSIPVITFIGLIASISNYENYDILMIRILFTLSISIVAIPFILLFIRTMPILYLIKKSSTIPFSR